MKNLFTQNIGYKILSVVLALLLWLTVMNVEDPAVTQTIEDVPVQIINDDVIKSRGYGYTIESGEKVDIKVKGRRSVVDNITAEDFTAVADFSSFSSMKMVPIEVKCTSSHANDLTFTARTDSMAIKLESELTASKSIRIDRMGEVKEGYYLYDYTTNTGLVSVNGAQSQVEKVKEVVAEVNIEGMKDSGELELDLYAVDSEGEKIDSKKITLVPETITVHLTIYPIKSVPLSVNTVGNPALYHYLGDIEFAPQSVEITGEEEVLKDLETIDVDVDILGVSADVEEQINLEEYLEEKYGSKILKLVDQTKTMGVKVHILAMEEKRFDLAAENIELTGKDEEKYTYVLTSNPSSNLVVRGKTENMVNIELSDFVLTVEVGGLEPGTYSMDIKNEYKGDQLIREELEVLTGKIDLVISEVYKEPEKPENGEGPDDNQSENPAEQGGDPLNPYGEAGVSEE